MTKIRINTSSSSHWETISNTAVLSSGGWAGLRCEVPPASSLTPLLLDAERMDGRTKEGKFSFFAGRQRRRGEKVRQNKTKKTAVHSVSGGWWVVGVWVVVGCEWGGHDMQKTASSNSSVKAGMVKALRAEASATPAASGCQGWLKT